MASASGSRPEGYAFRTTRAPDSSPRQIRLLVAAVFSCGVPSGHAGADQSQQLGDINHDMHRSMHAREGLAARHYVRRPSARTWTGTLRAAC